MKPFSIVTGTTQGLGREIAKRLAHTSEVLCVNRRPAGVESEMLVDLSRDDAVKVAAAQLIERVVAHASVDFYLNAAIYGDDEVMGDVTPVNAGGLFYTNVYSQLTLVERLLAAGVTVRLIAISSQMASVAKAPEAYHFLYGSSKAALNLCVRLMRSREPDLNYLLIDPGWMKTRLGGSEAPDDPGDVAARILRLVSDPTQWNRSDGMVQAMTGQITPW